jgi:A/G-specific adenine glycosylase
MNNMIRPHTFTKNIFSWYKKNHRRLPWRDTRDPYKIWISEIMLQQTTVATVIPYYKNWVETFPTIKDVAQAPLPKILKAWQGLGYYQRAKNIHRSARIVCDLHGDRIPSDRELLRRLPGFGPYTTAAVLSIAFGQCEPLIDANVRRVARRLLALKGPADVKEDATVLIFLEKLIPKRGTGIFNQALMELGALVCRSREPLCFSCPVKTHCLAYKKGWQDIIPAVPQRVFEKIEAVAAVIKKGERYFIQRRPAAGLLADLWEFPGGKIKKGESLEGALARELKEELGVSLVWARYFRTVKHAYTKFKVTLHVWLCEVTPLPESDKTHNWVSFFEFQRYPLPSATAMIVESLKNIPPR